MPKSDEFEWQPTEQIRCSHLVDKAIETIKAAPRDTENLTMDKVTQAFHLGHPYVKVEDGMPCFYLEHRLPPLVPNPYPPILGVIRGKVFILDGAEAAEIGRDTFQIDTSAHVDPIPVCLMESLAFARRPLNRKPPASGGRRLGCVTVAGEPDQAAFHLSAYSPRSLMNQGCCSGHHHSFCTASPGRAEL